MRYSQQGTPICSFTIAINRAFKKDEADFLNVVTFKRTAENVANYCDKGTQVAVNGFVQSRSYEKDGQKRYVVEIIANQVQFLDKTKKQSDDPFKDDGKTVDLSDEDLPF